MIATTDCAVSTLAPYSPSTENPWNQQKALHLIKRLGFGVNPTNVSSILQQNPSDFIDTLLDQTINLPLSEEPNWAYWSASDYQSNGQDPIDSNLENVIQWGYQWLLDMAGDNPVREKLTLFWHNHFVTKIETYQCASWMYQYHKLLQQYALGNFKDFVYEMGKTPAMLVFLNGVQNTVLNPNENYARELFELFTLGLDNGYTQQDITEAARALTGWNSIDVSDLCGPIEFSPISHDSGQKTIFGQTGNWDYDILHDLLFEERANEIAQHICQKVYRAFVHPEAETPEIIEELATTFIANDFELAPVFRQLFKSEHFFDPANIGVQIKSPLEFIFDFGNSIDYPINASNVALINGAASNLGQQIFNPPDVAGWPGNRDWIDNSQFSTRWSQMGQILLFTYESFPELLRNFAKTVSNNSNDPAVIAQTVSDYFVLKGFQNPMEYEKATIVLKSEVPENYYEDGSWNLDWDSAPGQVGQLIYFIVQVPEFQLT